MHLSGGKVLVVKVKTWSPTTSLSILGLIVSLAFILVIVIDKQVVKTKTSFLADQDKY